MHGRRGEGDPDKEQINIVRGDEGCVHRCCKEMQGVEDIKMEGGSGDVVKAEGTERYRKYVGDARRYHMSEREGGAWKKRKRWIRKGMVKDR